MRFWRAGRIRRKFASVARSHSVDRSRRGFTSHFSQSQIKSSVLAARFGKTGALRTGGRMSVVGWMEWGDRRRERKGHFYFLWFSFRALSLSFPQNKWPARWPPPLLAHFPPGGTALARSLSHSTHLSLSLSVSVAVRLSFTNSHSHLFFVGSTTFLSSFLFPSLWQSQRSPLPPLLRPRPVGRRDPPSVVPRVCKAE